VHSWQTSDFIPSPNVAEDHQTKNAKAIVDKGAAILLKEADIDSQFSSVFESLLQDEQQQQQLSQNIKDLRYQKQHLES
jgi:UDP-N-acetylglucosamine--N-acetylmuramyl-(pentapeptide) pyrophosphoryl-undecaprenol N-acetylglucosamine transferase